MRDGKEVALPESPENRNGSCIEFTGLALNSRTFASTGNRSFAMVERYYMTKVVVA